MKHSQLRIVFVILWLGSLAAAYYFGRQSGTRSGDPSVAGAGRQPGEISAGPSFLGEGGGGSAAGTEGGESEGGTAESGAAAGKSDLNVAALIATIRSQLGTGPGMMFNPTAMIKAMAPIADLSDDQVREALAEVEATVTDPQQKMMFLSLLLGRLAEADGAEAMAFIEENVSDSGFSGGVIMSVVGTWARRDPEAAWAWFLENRDSDRAPGMGQVTAVFSGMASQDLNGAFKRLEQLDDLERGQAIAGIAMGGAWDGEFRSKLLERAASLTPETRMELYRGMIGQWTMSDPDSAIEWMSGLSAEERKPLAQQAGMMLLMSQPERGAALMLEGVSEEQLPMTYSSIIGQWSRRDPNGAGEWLNQQPDGPHLDMARSSFASNVVRRDPYSAMEWAKTVSDENQRMATVRQVYGQWKGKDLTAADAALDRSGLGPEQIESIRTEAPESSHQTTAVPTIIVP